MRHGVHAVPLVATLLAVVLAGCATAEVRALKPEERPPLIQALDPLLRAVHGADVTKCQIATATIDEAYFDARIRRRGDGPCELGVFVTASALAHLTPRALQTLLAHELAHVQSRHAAGGERETLVRGRHVDMYVANEQFRPEEEAQADAAAARLLTVVWRGSNVGCLALADLYEDIARDRSRWGHWLSRHPFPERRVEAIVKACESEQRRPR
jgi:hypothetical protein